MEARHIKPFSPAALRLYERRLQEQGILFGEDSKLPPSNSLSLAQQSLWFLHQLAPEDAFYTIGSVLRLVGQLNVSALYWSLQVIVNRHQTLRTTFREGTQQIAASQYLALPIIDLHSLAASQQAETIEQLVQAEIQHPFSLEIGPLMRVKLLRIDGQTHILLLTMHHIISDGWSMSLFAHEFVELYRAALQRNPSPLPDLPLQYQEYVSWQQRWLQSQACQKEQTYWEHTLQGFPSVVELLTDYPRPELSQTQRYPGAHLPLTLTDEELASLTNFNHREQMTPFMTLFTAFVLLLKHYTRQQKLLICTDVANRYPAATESLIGFFINPLPLPIDFTGNLSLSALMKQVRDVTLSAYANQHLPFQKIVQMMNPPRNLNSLPLQQAKFVLLNTPAVQLHLPHLLVSMQTPTQPTTTFDLLMNLSQTTQGISGFFTYRTDLFLPSTAQRMLIYYRFLLHQLFAQNEMSLQDIETLLLEKERESQIEAQAKVRNLRKQLYKTGPWSQRKQSNSPPTPPGATP